MEHTVDQVRWRDTIATVESGSEPWEISTPTGESIDWRVALWVPDAEPPVVVFTDYGDVEFVDRQGDVPLSEDDLQRLREAFDDSGDPGQGGDGSSEEDHDQLLNDFLAMAERNKLDPDSEAAFDAAVREGLLRSLILYDAAGNPRPIRGYVPDIRQAFPGFVPVTMSTDGITTIWSWANGKLPLGSTFDAQRHVATIFKTRQIRIKIPHAVLSAETT